MLVSIRAEDVVLLQAGGAWQTGARDRRAGTVRTLTSEGAIVRIELDCGFPLVALLTRQSTDELSLAVGGRICALVKAPNVHLIPRA